MSSPSDAELRERFKIEVTAAGLELAADDYERLFVMWLEHGPEREALRRVPLSPEEEPLT
jgi:hypothetical protein